MMMRSVKTFMIELFRIRRYGAGNPTATERKRVWSFLAAMVLLIASPFAATAETADIPESECRYALIFVVDGIPNPQFGELMERGKLPNFREHIYERGVHSVNHFTVFPPLTFPAMASIFSGYYPSTHGIPTFYWVDREHAMYKNYLSTSVGEYQRDVSQRVRLIFEYFPEGRTLSFGLPINIGADRKRDVEGSFIDIFRESRDLDYISKAVEQESTIAPDMLFRPMKFLSLFNPARDVNAISLLNPLSQSGVLKYTISSFSESEFKKRGQVPEVVLYYDWAVDHCGHEDGPASAETLEALIDADTQFGRLVDVYRNAGLYENTYFMLLSDHGQMPLDPRYVRIDKIFSLKGFKVKFISHELMAKAGLSGLLRVGSLLAGSGPVVGYNCVIGSAGGGSVSVYLAKNGGTDADSWRQEVYHRDLLQYAADENTCVNVEDFINSIEGINLFFVRENERLPGEPQLTRIVSPHGSSLISARFEKNKPVELRYEVIQGADPLGYSENAKLADMIASGYHGDREWLRATAQTRYPDALVQIAQIMDLDRTASIILVPDDRHSFNSRVWSKHGGLSAGEMHTVFAISGPGLRRGVIQYSRTVDILPTFLHLMEKESASDDFDGIVLPLPQ